LDIAGGTFAVARDNGHGLIEEGIAFPAFGSDIGRFFAFGGDVLKIAWRALGFDEGGDPFDFAVGDKRPV